MEVLIVVLTLIALSNAQAKFSNVNTSSVFYVKEDEPVGFVIVQLEYTNPDNKSITPMIENDGGGPFVITSNNLQLSGLLDYEASKSYKLTINLNEGGTSSYSYVTFYVNVVNVINEDNLPNITVYNGSVTLNEESPVGTIVPFNYTVPNLVNRTAVYTLQDTSSIFTIDHQTGVITLNTKIDADSLPSPKLVYTTILEVNTSDARSSSVTLTLTIQDINDNPPRCNELVHYSSVAENTTALTQVYSLNCTDADYSPSFRNLSYTIVQGNTTLFSVNSSGAIETLGVLDYELIEKETLLIKVSDDGPHVVPTVTVIIVVTGINDNIPSFSSWQPVIPADSTYYLAENSSVGTTLFIVNATDNDKGIGSDITYSISATSGSLSIQNIFTIDPKFGAVTLVGQVDADNGPSIYNITVKASDGNNEDTRDVFIHVTDVNDNVPRFVGLPYNVTVWEQNCTANFIIANLTTSDADVSSGNLTINVDSIVYGFGTKTDWEIISTSPTTGQLILKRTLDLDKNDTSVYLLKITVRDGGSPELTGTTSLTLYILPDNEFKPEIIHISDQTIPENETIGTVLETLTASDNDKGLEGQLVYSIKGGNNNSAFDIDSIGNLRLVQRLDKEHLEFYNLTIEVRDSGVDQKTATALINITVTDVNEFMPECPSLLYITYLDENATVNTSVYQFNCSDRDGDLLTYTVQWPENTTFSYSTALQGLKLSKEVDYDSSTQQYTVKVDVSDGKFTTVVSLRILLNPINEFPPDFWSNVTINITENSKPNNPILNYTATDRDYSPHNIVKYSLKPDASINSLFSIEPSSGDISLIKALDYESLPDGHKFYLLEVTAEDGGGLQGSGTVTVSVLDVNDNAPKCSHEFFTVHVNETQTGSGPYDLISSLDCKDVEDGNHVNFSLVQTPGSHFSLNNQTLQLINNTLDYEIATTHILTITVSDNGLPSLNSTVMIYVKVLNMNDGPPIFQVTSPIHISESSDIGTNVTIEKATDPDGNDLVFGDPQYSIISGDPTNQFSIGLTSGEIVLRKALDYETVPSYEIVIKAIERGGELSTTANITIIVDDVNDEVPVCSPNSIFKTVSENETVNYTIASLSCTDKDAGTVLTYTIADTNNTLFQLDSNTLRLKSQLDFETATYHQFRVIVSDGIHTVQVDVRIIVGSINEFPPVFDKAIYMLNVSEAANVPSLIDTVHANDSDSPLDENGIVRYMMANNPDFVIDYISGEILVARGLDREIAPNYTIMVTALDADYVVNASIHITVLDINDNPPVFTSALYSGKIAENSTAGTIILRVTATDKDDPLTNGYGAVTYAIVGNNSYFKINESTGEIQNTRELDTDVTGIIFYTFNVSATDSFGLIGALSDTTLVNILVTTVNQHQPVFSSSTYNVTIKENQFSFGDVILSVTASDNDTGRDGEFYFDFISSQAKFSLTQNGSFGVIRLKDTLDFDKSDQLFVIEIKVTDKGNPPRSSTTTVSIHVDDVNDNPPVCTSVFYLARAEGTNDTSIVNLHCSDADKSNNLTYTVLRVTPDEILVNISSTGVVSTSAPLDYEISDFYEIVILVQDDRPPVHNATVIINLKVIDINDNDPSFFDQMTFSVYENDTVDGKVLYRVNASGNDGPTDVVTYSLQDRTFFEISPTTGEISIRTAAPDYEKFRDHYNLTVCAVDTPNPVRRTACQNIMVTIYDVNDNIPVFDPSVYSKSVKENVPIGTILGTVTATDKDISPTFNTVHYSIIGDSEGKFSIDNNGSITVNTSLDYETKKNYSLLILASDSLNNATVYFNILVLPVNEYAPEFIALNLTLTVPENTQFDSNYTLNISATDKDAGLDGQIYYTIEPGPFNINPYSGVLKVVGNLDRETQQKYVLLVKAIDYGTPPMTGTATLTVEVTDVNDNIPTCTSDVFTGLIPEGIRAQSQLITKLTCQDDDQDPNNLNNKINYTIVSGETTKFEMDQSGNLMLKANVTLDYESDKRFEVVVKVADNGVPTQLSSTVIVQVLVTDVNDNPPLFKTLPKLNVSEDTSVGNKLTTVHAIDADSGNNGLVKYSITKGNDKVNNESYFTINPWSGEVYLTKQLDFEQKTLYELEITATDQGTSPQFATGTLTIYVLDVNDNRPVCDLVTVLLNLPENSKGVDVAYLNCFDVDTVGSLTYTIISGSDSALFTINQTGVIRVTSSAQIDFETTQQLSLEVKISDGVHDVTSFVKITVTDLDEFDPKFSPPGPYSLSVQENVSLNSLLITVNATDNDTFDNIRDFSIVGGNSENKFLIDPITGSVRILNSLDYEKTKFYSLTLQVKDSGNRTSTSVLNITVLDVNDNHPFCNTTWFVVSVFENESGKVLFTPDCYDLDTNLNPNDAYKLVSGNISSLDLNKTTGAVYLMAPLDFETMTSHTMIIKAFDNGPPDVGIDITLTIIINPVNEYNPVFNPTSQYNVSVPEDAPIGFEVATLNATDLDKGYLQGTVRYYLVANTEYFEMDERTGEIKTVRQLDRELISSYNLSVEAVDDYPGSPDSRSSYASVIISILDVNDNTPVFSKPFYVATLSEMDENHEITTVRATDKDDPQTRNFGTVTYAIVQGGSDFTINNITGQINNSHVLDADLTGKTVYTIMVTATDSLGAAGALTSTALVVVTVSTVNEYTPEFSSPSYSITLNETQVKFGNEILSFSARDNDTGLDGEFTFDFAVPQTKFAIVQSDKAGKLILNDYLDYEKNDTLFQFQILAKDKGSSSRTGTTEVTVILNDMNDNFPSCVSVVNVDLPENTNQIANVTCTDQDAKTTFNYTVFSITPATMNVSVNLNGVVTVSPALDYETQTFYQIIIQVVDTQFGNPVHTASVVINVRVSDLNDNKPSFNGPFSFTIKEDYPVSSNILYRVNATGNDGLSDYLTYSVYPTTYFTVTPLSGEITLKSTAPDFETVGSLYILTVCVMDTPNPVSFTVCQNISVTIEDVNDNKPVFSPAVYTSSVSESDPKDTRLGTVVTAKDRDSSAQFNTITYSILDGNSAQKFRINSTTGVIFVAQELDYETVTSYFLIIQATDGMFTANASYSIQVLPVNDFTPTFNVSTLHYNITENTLTNFTFNLDFNVTDGDSGLDGQFTYSIDQGPLEIDPVSGLLSVVANIDRETNQEYTLHIRATDKGSPPKTGTLTLIVTVLDVNDNAPTCTQTFYTALIVESIMTPSIIASLNCLDRDLDPLQHNNAISYTMTSNTTNWFEVTSLGVIKVKNGVSFDREVEDFYPIVVEVSDQSLTNKLTTTVIAEVTIADLNDNFPVFNQLPSVYELENITVGTYIITAQANDSDIGPNAELVYSILSGNTGNKFRIDKTDGTVYLESSLDYETVSEYQLIITASDKGSPPLTGTVTLTIFVKDVNDNPPNCAFSTPVALPENSQNVSIQFLSCSDRDTVGTLKYSIVAGNEENNFVVDANGNVFAVTNATLDYEIKQAYVLQILVTDGVNNVNVTLKVTLTDVNEFKPQFSPVGPYSTTVKENASVGNVVFVLSATDGDIYDHVKVFTITGGNSNQKFTLDVNKIKIFSSLDYELEKSYTLSLMVQDSTGLNNSTTLTILVEDINDNSPVCNESFVVVSVDENVSSKVLYSPSCTDADKVASPSLGYTISSAVNAALSLNNDTGVLSLISGLDYETITSLDVVIRVSDNGSPALSTSINIKVNVNPVNEFNPRFTSYFYGPFSLQENVTIGTQVAALTASDDDKGLLQGTVRYQIIAGDDQQVFYIEELTGVLKVIKNLDRESKDNYNLTLKASDDMPGSVNQKTGITTVGILVTDVNDNIPTFTQTLYFLNISESAKAGPAVELLKFVVQDADVGVNSQTTIAITSGNTENKFSINGASLILQSELDYETTSRYDLILSVTDNGSPKLSSTCWVIIEVLPSNDNSPLMNVTSLTKTIPEDTAVGTLIFDADASDLDKGMQGKITYDIVSGVTSNEFVINSATGQLYIGSALDFDAGPRSYSIIVRATDGDILVIRTATASLSIILTDVNDNAPLFTTNNFLFNLNENSAAGLIVGQILVTDADSGSNGLITLNLIGGNGLPYFTVNANKQLVTTSKNIDYEMNKALFLTMTATDGGSPSYTSNGLVRVDINNLNDNVPTISPSDFTVHVIENSGVGTLVQSYTASDLDTPVSVFMMSAVNPYFDLNSTTGVLTVKTTLDREKVSNHTLNVVVVDSTTYSDNTTLNSATATLTVIVDDVNDNAPVITGTYSKVVNETATVNELVFTIAATDADAGINSALVYAITDGNIGDSFKIDFMGNILVARPLNPDVTNSYSLTVTVTDRGTPPLSSSIVVYIYVNAVNHPPVFDLSSYVFDIDENSPVGRIVGTVTAYSASTQLTYSLPLASFPLFNINSTSGVISVSSANLDREKVSQYRGVVQVVDGGVPSLLATASVIINVNDLDDNGPVFNPDSYRGVVIETATVGTSLVQLTTTDADTPVNSGVVYNISINMLNGNIAASLFQVNAAGLVTIKSALDYETYKNVSFIIMASKPNSQPSVSASILIVITDANDNIPVMKSSFLNTEVDYTKSCGDIVSQVLATDADSGDNSRIVYSIDTTAYGTLFTVDTVTGEIKMTTAATSNTKYTLVVRASDLGVPQLSSTATVRIDTFNPVNTILSFDLAISKTNFLSQEQVFLNNLENQLKLKFPNAVLKLWCITERLGVAQEPGTASNRRKRQTTSQPVTVGVYALQDGSTDSLNNLGQSKQFLSQGDLLAAFSDIATGKGGPQYSYYSIQSVKPYSGTDSGTDWWHTIYGPIITAILIALGIILLAVLIFCCCRRHRKKKKSERTSSSEEPEIPAEDYSHRYFKGYQGVDFYPFYPRPFPVRLVNGDPEQFSNPYFSKKHYSHL